MDIFWSISIENNAELRKNSMKKLKRDLEVLNHSYRLLKSGQFWEKIGDQETEAFGLKNGMREDAARVLQAVPASGPCMQIDCCWC